MASPFQFLHAEWPDVCEAASKAGAADELFTSPQLYELLAVLDQVRSTAQAA